jgi:hypothetical protein
MIATHNIENISFEDGYIVLTIDAKLIKIKLEKISKKLALADSFQRDLYKISPSGYGIHWPLIDENSSVAAILKTLD